MAKVAKKNVEYLAFEGGGGKGIAYLGALQALKELEIVSYVKEKRKGQTYTRLDPKKIRGVAGTSVGSLTALLVACGYTPPEVEDILTSKIGENVLDTVEFELKLFSNSPFSSFLITSDIPPTFKAIIGVSHAKPSRIIVGTPSNREGISINLL